MNIGHDQTWELFPTGAGMLSVRELHDCGVLSADASSRLGQISYLKDTFELGFCSSQTIILCGIVVAHPFSLGMGVFSVKPVWRSCITTVQSLKILFS